MVKLEIHGKNNQTGNPIDFRLGFTKTPDKEDSIDWFQTKDHIPYINLHELGDIVAMSLNRNRIILGLKSKVKHEKNITKKFMKYLEKNAVNLSDFIDDLMPQVKKIEEDHNFNFPFRMFVDVPDDED